ncbi:uncharacterized protein BYT42DRAFT_648031 [Radiomyces spectabilis]|uniref:uncharacterized protein n=1 Tax=Radiomyces spectabilis TaxID=64574 RepID=UPI00222103B2|nr:uncharacterized protein BYT42DRAFT_648031 [Radiomyces spectabilis]KAI8369333.1 hypothetical protein BYT42DRAFT_648031 [Radiomyces spectabilis]
MKAWKSPLVTEELSDDNGEWLHNNGHGEDTAAKKEEHAGKDKDSWSFDEDPIPDRYFDPTQITTSLPLLPFQNQVGGHASFFRFSKRAICKPVSQKEQEFYEHLEAHHHALLPFTSQYLGTLNVTYRTSCNVLLPEVVFDKNEQLLRDWRACYVRRPSSSLSSSRSSSTQSEDDNLPHFSHTYRHHSRLQSHHHMHPPTRPPSHDNQASIHRARKLQELVLREVFSPKALKERLQQVHDWEVSRAQGLSNSQSMDNLTKAGQASHDKLIWSSIDSVTVQPRRPSIIQSTTSAPQSPRMREASLQRPLSDPIETPRGLDQRTSSVASLPLLNDTPSDHVVADDSYVEPAAQPASWRPRRAPTNPWSLQVYSRDLHKTLSQIHSGEETVKKFILLEDLTDDVKYPCVLDLKMGTRQHGVHATPAKMASQSLKCMRSTSKTLGVRVCGMQIYKTDQRRFVFRDKYYGRQLDANGFRRTLMEYLDNGEGCQIQHIPIIIRKLKRLARIIGSMPGYRFYASSLLVIYDAGNWNRKIDVRIIDFAHCVTQQELKTSFQDFTYPPNDDGPDGGYLLGLKTLTDCFHWIYQQESGSVLRDDV